MVVQVEFAPPCETFSVELFLLGDDDVPVFEAGPGNVTLCEGEVASHQPELRYVGVGSDAESVVILPASQTRDKDALTKEGVEKVLIDLAEMGIEYIVCDSPAGIETGALMAMHFADEALIVTNPEVSSVRDSDRILGILGSKTKRAIEGKEPIKEHLLITRYNPSRVEGGQMLSLDDIQEILRTPLIGVIPESESVLDASNQGLPALQAELTGGDGFDYAFEAIGIPLTMRAAFDATRRGGTTCVIGAGGFDQEVSFNGFELFYSEKTFVGSYYGSADVRSDFNRILRLWKTGRLDLEGMITRKLGLEDVNDAIADLKAGEVIRQVITFD